MFRTPATSNPSPCSNRWTPRACARRSSAPAKAEAARLAAETPPPPEGPLLASPSVTGPRAARRGGAPGGRRRTLRGDYSLQAPRMGQSGRPSPWQFCARCLSVAAMSRRASALRSSSCTCSSAMRLTSALGAAAVAPQRQQLVHLLDRESQVARAAHETQRVQLVVAVDAVSRLGAQRRADQSDAFVVADHLGGNARGLGGLSDVHHVGSCVVRRRAQARAACGRKVFRRSALPARRRWTAPWRRRRRSATATGRRPDARRRPAGSARR